MLDEVDSTNTYALQCLAEGGITPGTAWFARYQSAGRGQRGKAWQAAPDESINLSVFFQPQQLPLARSFIFNALVALGVYDFFAPLAGDATTLKWPNDLYWEDKKAGGVLIENQIRGSRWTQAVVGIGINLNQRTFPAALPHAVSLRQITGRHWPPEALARQLCSALDRRYRRLDPAADRRILAEYEGHLFRLNQWAPYEMEGEVFDGRIRGVLPDGRLILQRGRQELRVDFGRIRFVL